MTLLHIFNVCLTTLSSEMNQKENVFLSLILLYCSLKHDFLIPKALKIILWKPPKIYVTLLWSPNQECHILFERPSNKIELWRKESIVPSFMFPDYIISYQFFTWKFYWWFFTAVFNFFREYIGVSVRSIGLFPSTGVAWAIILVRGPFQNFFGPVGPHFWKIKNWKWHLTRKISL